MKTVPVVITGPDSALFGILRQPAAADRLVILLPAATGTRIGPQEIYVQIARTLLDLNIASLCVDLPPNGDSYDHRPPQLAGSTKERLTRYYGTYLDQITAYLDQHHSFREYILLSISVGCVPVLEYARRNQYARVILLSPHHLSGEKPVVNKRNVSAYRQKLFRAETWRKLLTLQINFRKIIGNVFTFPARGAGVEKAKAAAGKPDELAHRVHILNVFGEKDPALAEYRLFWEEHARSGTCAAYTEKIIAGADHSFFGWHFKAAVCADIAQWLAPGPPDPDTVPAVSPILAKHES